MYRCEYLATKKSARLGISSAALAERGHGRLDDLEPIVEVFPELAAQHHLFEVAIGRGHDAHIDVDALVAAKLGELGVLQDVEQLGLQRRLHLADLVQEDRPEMGLFELADASRRRAGEGALLVAEQLALEQLRRQRRAIHLHERLAAARRALVNRAGDELLADAAFAANQHGDVAVGDLIDDERHLLHRWTVAPADERLALIVAQLASEIGELAHEAGALDGLLDRDVEGDLAEPLGIVGLDDVVGRSEPDRFDDDLRLLAAGQHDHLQLGTRRFERLQRLQSVHARHGDIQEHDIGRLALADCGDNLVTSGVRASLRTRATRGTSADIRQTPNHRRRPRSKVASLQSRSPAQAGGPRQLLSSW